MGDARYFSFWCERCPTRIKVETEVTGGSLHDEPEYTFATSEWVGLARAREATEDDDGLVVAKLCPACGSPLHDVDILVTHGELGEIDFSKPVFTQEQESETHARWRVTRSKEASG